MKDKTREISDDMVEGVAVTESDSAASSIFNKVQGGWKITEIGVSADLPHANQSNRLKLLAVPGSGGGVKEIDVRLWLEVWCWPL